MTILTSWRRDGYAVLGEPLFSPGRFDDLTGIFEEHLAEHGERIFDELDMPHRRDERLLELLLNERLLNLVEPITGPDIVLWSSGFICKLPFTGPRTPWHTDAAYWEGRLDNDEGIVTVWLALDRSSADNGCMRVIPGSHRHAPRRYRQRGPDDTFFRTEAVDVDESTAVDLELEPNHCSLHDGRILHGANANTGPHRRAGYTMRYLPATTRIIPQRNRGHDVWLARGEPVADNAYVNA
ncbi:MAG TPA: phytanoyl-CoA dioxygenase family protein [Stackebrandtia sp.]|jgi:ectoine hydroxylase-related dioxygenase (phytanoyl-CoA dioxygenase family)|uniref:phytanoyl-CoA dioxygenase family protein n=1 Tax=Stackebrandtia sp. TaxID=2023065 RepID=UPI002D2E163A|nr:phytanoyl-CoA dioxygenase family protein [Stackebrandtia sp.]HZE41873.1 phytanoyl-CoA dioxygenase family protein [Stackebrandtia sp.]